MEIVSPDPKDRKRDFDDKLADYAEAGIAEYWIVDAEQQCVIVHRLDGKQYAVYGQFTGGQQATSILLNGFAVDVSARFAVADDVAE